MKQKCAECPAEATWILSGPDIDFQDYLVCDEHSNPVMRLSSRIRIYKPPPATGILNFDYFPQWMKTVTMRSIHNGELIPPGYGIAWKPWNQDAVIVMPIPLNIVVKLARWFYYGSMHFGVLDEIEKAEQAGYERGLVAGRRLHIDRLKKEFMEELLKDLDRHGSSR